MKRPSLLVALLAGTLMLAGPAVLFCTEMATTMLYCPMDDATGASPCEGLNEMSTVCCVDGERDPIRSRAQRATGSQVDIAPAQTDAPPVRARLEPRVLPHTTSRHGPPPRTLYASFLL